MALLLQNGDQLLLQAGDVFLLQSEGAPTPVVGEYGWVMASSITITEYKDSL